MKMTSQYATIDDLPFEIVDLISDEIGCPENDVDAIPTFTAFRLISPWINAVVAQKLFKTVYLTRPGSWVYKKGGEEANDRAQRFLLLLEANPTITTHIRSFHVDVNCQRTQTQSWFPKNKYLPKILPKLTHLRQISLEACSRSLGWYSFSPTLAQSLQDAFQSPSLTKVVIVNISCLPLDIIVYRNSPLEKGSKPAKRLSRKSAVVVDTLPFTLQELSICPLTVSLLRCGNVLDVQDKTVRHIHRLKLYTPRHARGFEPLEKNWRFLLKILGSNLKELEYEGKESGYHLYRWPSGDAFPYLKVAEKLIFHTVANEGGPWSHLHVKIPLPSRMTSFLNSEKPVPCIRAIRLAILMPFTHDDRPIWRCTKEWKELATMLPILYPNLQSLIVEFQADVSHRRRWSPVVECDVEDFKQNLSGMFSVFFKALPYAVLEVKHVNGSTFELDGSPVKKV